ncbi:ABC transporter ATP-binding protein [Anaerophilus nitritogenes]|uniref:ABC transporter ATP-binding protein n=1 Tax=Anaerophilus nitritogenes TaxID=2498136 RepID=UPI00101C6D35|nr:ATP-binding cassette domain-containing protein [Anaerophilus nitritogenes]
MLQIQNLSKTFHKDTVNEKIVFEKFSLQVEKGDFITIIGSNGAGKSTLLNMISGSIPMDMGNILLREKDISKEAEYKRTKMIGRVFQDPTMGTSPSMTIFENLSMAAHKGKKFNLTMGISKKDISQFIDLVGQLSLGLEEQMNTKVGLLSGGQRQALALLMSTISNPDVLLLDEHTAALDPRTSERIIELTQKIVEEKKITTLMVTHNLHQAISIGNRLIMMHKGNIILDIKGQQKNELTIEKLLNCFETVQKDDVFSDRLLFS